MSDGFTTRNLRRPVGALVSERRDSSGSDARSHDCGASPSLDPARRPHGLTSVSRSVFAVAAALRSALASRTLGPYQRTLWVSAPARSTQSGVRSKQLLSLVTPWCELPCGWLDLVEAKCALVTWDVLASRQHVRETDALEFSRDEYLAFAGWVSDLLAPMKIRVNWASRRACGSSAPLRCEQEEG